MNVKRIMVDVKPNAQIILVVIPVSARSNVCQDTFQMETPVSVGLLPIVSSKSQFLHLIDMYSKDLL